MDVTTYFICRCDGTTVYVGLLVDGREVAVKEVLKKNSKSLETEIGILAKIKPHNNVVAYKVANVRFTE